MEFWSLTESVSQDTEKQGQVMDKPGKHLGKYRQREFRTRMTVALGVLAGMLVTDARAMPPEVIWMTRSDAESRYFRLHQRLSEDQLYILSGVDPASIARKKEADAPSPPPAKPAPSWSDSPCENKHDRVYTGVLPYSKEEQVVLLCLGKVVGVKNDEGEDVIVGELHEWSDERKTSTDSCPRACSIVVGNQEGPDIELNVSRYFGNNSEGLMEGEAAILVIKDNGGDLSGFFASRQSSGTKPVRLRRLGPAAERKKQVAAAEGRGLSPQTLKLLEAFQASRYAPPLPPSGR